MCSNIYGKVLTDLRRSYNSSDCSKRTRRFAALQSRLNAVRIYECAMKSHRAECYCFRQHVLTALEFREVGIITKNTE